MIASSSRVVFGPRERRIVRLAASPNGEFLALQHVPQNYYTGDYHWLLFRRSGGTYGEIGEMPGDLSRLDAVPLDDGHCLVLETDRRTVQLARFALSAKGMTETARWKLFGTLSFEDATLRLFASGREALVLVTERDDKQVDWGGGPPPDYIQTWMLVDVATGEVRRKDSETRLGEPPLARRLYSGSRGVSVLVALGAPPWVGTRDGNAAREIIEGLREGEEHAIQAGRTHLLTNKRVIDIASGETVLRLAADAANRFEPQPCFHALSPDENYALSTVPGGDFALWNIAQRSAWQPALPAHGGVHVAVPLPGGRAALGTKQGGVVVLDCKDGLALGKPAW